MSVDFCLASVTNDPPVLLYNRYISDTKVWCKSLAKFIIIVFAKSIACDVIYCEIPAFPSTWELSECGVLHYNTNTSQ